MNDEEVFQRLQEEHESFWRETLYPPYRPPLRERLWDWLNDHHGVMTGVVFVLFLGLLIFSFFHLWLLGLFVIMVVIGSCGYVIWCAASGVVQWVLDWLI